MAELIFRSVCEITRVRGFGRCDFYGIGHWIGRIRFLLRTGNEKFEN